MAKGADLFRYCFLIFLEAVSKNMKNQIIATTPQENTYEK
jgi:hypothetical protein